MQCVLSLLAWTEGLAKLQSAIFQDYRIDQLSALHAALAGVVRQILAPLCDHESSAARTTIRAVDSCPASIRRLNRLLLCHRHNRTHRNLPQRSTGLRHVIHHEA
jgi:hypothetical protein